MNRTHRLFVLALSVLLCVGIGCSESPTTDEESETPSIGERLDQTLDMAREQLDKLKPATESAGQSASDEVEKLFRYEYTVHSLPVGTSAEDLEAALVKLGAERWDCFHVDTQDDHTRIWCKRRPKTYLRYLSHVL